MPITIIRRPAQPAANGFHADCLCMRMVPCRHVSGRRTHAHLDRPGLRLLVAPGLAPAPWAVAGWAVCGVGAAESISLLTMSGCSLPALRGLAVAGAGVSMAEPRWRADRLGAWEGPLSRILVLRALSASCAIFIELAACTMCLLRSIHGWQT